MTDTFNTSQQGKRIRFTNTDGETVTGTVHDQQFNGHDTEHLWIITDKDERQEHDVYRNSTVEVLD